MVGTGQAAAILLTLLCAEATAARDGRALDLVQPVRISTNSDFSVFDCDFKASEMFGATRYLNLNPGPLVQTLI